LCYSPPMIGSGLARAMLLGAAAVALAGAAPPHAPGPPVARSYATPFRTDTVQLPLGAGGGESEAVYVVHMKPGEVLVYGWSVEGGGAPDDFYAELSGTKASKTPSEPRFYRKGTGTSAAGSLTAPVAGTYSWLFKNDSEKPATVTLTVAGFYDLPSLRESMGLEGPEYIPFGPTGWPDRFGPAKK
jgi:hypothetical protein